MAEPFNLVRLPSDLVKHAAVHWDQLMEIPAFRAAVRMPLQWKLEELEAAAETRGRHAHDLRPADLDRRRQRCVRQADMPVGHR